MMENDPAEPRVEGMDWLARILETLTPAERAFAMTHLEHEASETPAEEAAEHEGEEGEESEDEAPPKAAVTLSQNQNLDLEAIRNGEDQDEEFDEYA